jgi:hypothetical protein
MVVVTMIEKVKQLYELNESIGLHAMPLLKWYHEEVEPIANYKHLYFEYIDHYIENNGDHVSEFCYKGEETYCGETDYYEFTLNLELIYRIPLRMKLIAEAQEKKRIKEDKELQRKIQKEKSKIATEQRERDLLKNLKEKYEK